MIDDGQSTRQDAAVPARRHAVAARLPLGLRLLAFGLLERLSAVRTGASPSTSATPVDPGPGAPSVWLFVSTIGEVNAIEPLIRRFLSEAGNPPLTLLTDRTIYDDAYRVKFPEARVVRLDGSSRQVRRLAGQRPPLLLMVAEIPAMLHDAPCRFPFAAVHAARRAGAPAVLVNGWLYGYRPESRMDIIECGLFADEYVRSFDLSLVQTADIRARLIAAGARPETVQVMGNVKFDAMRSITETFVPTPLHAALARRCAAGPVVVAGSVTEMADQKAIVDGFSALRERMPGAFLVLAPRHPENRPRMAGLRDLLAQRGWQVAYRSECEADRAADGDMLVLDTIGELRGCYAHATVAFVGVDHNVLEPMAFGRPTFVADGWEPTYPSYPVYRQLMDAGALHAVGPIADIGKAWLDFFGASGQGGTHKTADAEPVLARARGAVDRAMAALRAGGMVQRCAAGRSVAGGG